MIGGTPRFFRNPKDFQTLDLQKSEGFPDPCPSEIRRISIPSPSGNSDPLPFSIIRFLDGKLL
jgi:hypothetical protein